MAGGPRIAQEAQDLARPVVEGLGLELVDVEYKKEGAEWYLRFFIDKPGGVGIDDCQAASRAIDPLLYEKMDIPGHYSLEVSSPGLERPFKSERDYLRNLGNPVEVSLFKPKDGMKRFEGLLKEYRDGAAVIDAEGGNTVSFDKDAISRIHRVVRF
jgi:ribosome maturation factor RimP